MGITSIFSRNKGHENSAFTLATWAHRIGEMGTFSNEIDNRISQEKQDSAKTPNNTETPVKSDRFPQTRAFFNRKRTFGEAFHEAELDYLCTPGKALTEITKPFLDENLNADSYSDLYRENRNHFVAGMKNLGKVRLPDGDTTKLANFMATNEVFKMFIENIRCDSNELYEFALSSAIKSIIDNAPEDEIDEIDAIFKNSILLTNALPKLPMQKIEPEADAEQVDIPVNG